MAIESAPLSYADLVALPDERPRQLIEGAVVVTPSPTWRHQAIHSNLFHALSNHVRAHDLGKVMSAPLDVVFRADAPGIVLQPDLLFVAKARLPEEPSSPVTFAPDLVIEILSPSTAPLDTRYKRRVYAAHGVREYWIIPSEIEHVEVLRLADGGVFAKPLLFEPSETLTSDLLPGLALAVDEVFAP